MTESLRTRIEKLRDDYRASVNPNTMPSRVLHHIFAKELEVALLATEEAPTERCRSIFCDVRCKLPKNHIGHHIGEDDNGEWKDHPVAEEARPTPAPLPICPTCKSASEVTPYEDEEGTPLYGCARCTLNFKPAPAPGFGTAPPQFEACMACGSTRVVHAKDCKFYSANDERVERSLMEPEAGTAQELPETVYGIPGMTGTFLVWTGSDKERAKEIADGQRQIIEYRRASIGTAEGPREASDQVRAVRLIREWREVGDAHKWLELQNLIVALIQEMRLRAPSGAAGVEAIVECAREVDLWQDKLMAGLNPPNYCPPLERLHAALRSPQPATGGKS